MLLETIKLEVTGTSYGADLEIFYKEGGVGGAYLNLNEDGHNNTSKGWWLATPVHPPLLIRPLKDCPMLVNSDCFFIQVQSRSPASVQMGELLHYTTALMGLRPHRAN